MAICVAHTGTLGAGSTDSIPGVMTFGSTAVEVLVRAAGAGVFIGGSAVTATDGYELEPNQEYRFVLHPITQLMAGSAEYGLSVKNTTGSGVVVSYIVTPLSS